MPMDKSYNTAGGEGLDGLLYKILTGMTPKQSIYSDTVNSLRDIRSGKTEAPAIMNSGKLPVDLQVIDQMLLERYGEIPKGLSYEDRIKLLVSQPELSIRNEGSTKKRQLYNDWMFRTPENVDTTKVR
jgi:hypothetical protein